MKKLLTIILAISSVTAYTQTRPIGVISSGTNDLVKYQDTTSTIATKHDLDTLTIEGAETDPIYSSDPASSITSQDLTDIQNLSGVNTGDQDLSGYIQDVDTGAMLAPYAKQIALEDTAAAIRADFPTGSGTGDMLKSVYDTDDDGKADTSNISEGITDDATTEFDTVSAEGLLVFIADSGVYYMNPRQIDSMITASGGGGSGDFIDYFPSGDGLSTLVHDSDSTGNGNNGLTWASLEEISAGSGTIDSTHTWDTLYAVNSYIISSTDSTWIERPRGTFAQRIDNISVEAGSESDPVYASDSSDIPKVRWFPNSLSVLVADPDTGSTPGTGVTWASLEEIQGNITAAGDTSNYPTPDYQFQEFLDTSTNEFYKAVGTERGDWVKLNYLLLLAFPFSRRKLLTLLTALTLCLSLQAQTDTVYTISYGGSSYKIVYDTTQGPLGPELVTNGDFDGDLSGWGNPGGWSWDLFEGKGVARFTPGTAASLNQNGAIENNGDTYRTTIKVGDVTAGSVRLKMGSNGWGSSHDSPGTYEEDITQSFNDVIYITPSSDFDGYIDDISVRKINE